MKTLPKVSVLMPNYNAWKYISEAIQSILNQTFTDFEFIIIDDCSTDNSWEIIQEFAKKDTRIIPIKNEKNIHIAKTRNIALAKARGEFIAFLDSDDVAEKDRLELQLDFIERNPNIDLCGSNMLIIDSNWNINWEKKYPETDLECKNSIWFKNPFWQNTMIIKRKCFLEVGFYDDDFRNAEDLDMWVRMWQKYKFYNIQRNLVRYRIFWWNSILKQQKLMIKNTLRVRKKALKLWYKITFKWRFYYFWTWFMQFLPSKFVLWLFNKLQ